MNDASDPKAPRPEGPASGRETVPEDDDEVAAAAETVERTSQHRRPSPDGQGISGAGTDAPRRGFDSGDR